MKVLSVYRTELKECDKVGCRKKEALDQRAGPVLKQCTEKGMSRKTGKAKGRNGGGWSLVRCRKEVSSCDVKRDVKRTNPEPAFSATHWITEQEKPTREKQPESIFIFNLQPLTGHVMA